MSLSSPEYSKFIYNIASKSWPKPTLKNARPHPAFAKSFATFRVLQDTLTEIEVLVWLCLSWMSVFKASTISVKLCFLPASRQCYKYENFLSRGINFKPSLCNLLEQWWVGWFRNRILPMPHQFQLLEQKTCENCVYCLRVTSSQMHYTPNLFIVNDLIVKWKLSPLFHELLNAWLQLDYL